MSDLDIDEISISSVKSINYGGTSGSGLELLMNDKKRSNRENVTLDKINVLEKELNDLSGSGGGSVVADTTSLSGFFNFGNSTNTSAAAVPPPANVGQATMDSLGGNPRTWDGYGKMGSEKPPTVSGAPMNEREKRRKKKMMIKKLEEWHEKKYIKNYHSFNDDSPYEEVEDEYESAQEDKRRKEGIKLQQWWFMTLVNSLEFGNSYFDPFGLNLDGWGEKISEEIDSYDEIFGELHDKYKGGKLAPELSLLLRLGFSAAMVNITNKALSTATPGFNDVIKQSPELMKMFTQAAAQSMSQQSPGFDFLNNIVNNPGGQEAPPTNNTYGPPPPPIETKNQPPSQRPMPMNYTDRVNPKSRPDLQSDSRPLFRDGGIEVGNGYESVNIQQQQQRTMRPPPGPSTQRPDMRGPTNSPPEMEQLLSNLKPRTTPSPRNTSTMDDGQSSINLNDSMVSVSSLRDVENTALPKKVRTRKPRSERNIMTFTDI